jgi:hypothetical protein
MTKKLYLVMIIEYLVIEECVKKKREKKERDKKKMVSTLGLLLFPCYVISKYDLIVLISKIPYMDT